MIFHYETNQERYAESQPCEMWRPKRQVNTWQWTRPCNNVWFGKPAGLSVPACREVGPNLLQGVWITLFSVSVCQRRNLNGPYIGDASLCACINTRRTQVEQCVAQRWFLKPHACARGSEQIKEPEKLAGRRWKRAKHCREVQAENGWWIWTFFLLNITIHVTVSAFLGKKKKKKGWVGKRWHHKEIRRGAVLDLCCVTLGHVLPDSLKAERCVYLKCLYGCEIYCCVLKRVQCVLSRHKTESECNSWPTHHNIDSNQAAAPSLSTQSVWQAAAVSRYATGLQG